MGQCKPLASVAKAILLNSRLSSHLISSDIIKDLTGTSFNGAGAYHLTKRLPGFS